MVENGGHYQKNMETGTQFIWDLGSVHIKSESKIKAREMVEIKIESSLS